MDYNTYVMTKKEKLFYLILSGIFIFALGYIFYRNVILAFILVPLALFYPKIKAKELLQLRKNKLNFQFKDLLYCVCASMSAGRSLEFSFKDALGDLKIIYPDNNEYIIKECEQIVANLEMNEPIEDILEDFAHRSKIDDIESFVDVLKSCKSAGGNLVQVISETTRVINDKVEINNEIETMIASKKFEQKLMSLAPVAMILILTMSAGDYMQPIFNTIQGRLAMTGALVTMVITYFISKSIMDIKV